MKNPVLLQASSAILNRAKELGASLAGFASVKTLKNAPSFSFAPQMPSAYTGAWDNGLGLGYGQAAWPEEAKSFLIFALAHPEDKPEMDWWVGMKNPPGNRTLITIARTLAQWIHQTYNIDTVELPYRVEKGGTYLKDAAVLAGLGCIGKNNLLVTPEFGPRIRLRALAIAADLPSTGPRDFNPCSDCQEFCRKACPRKAFNSRIYSPTDFGQERLPGRDGNFFRPMCKEQMKRNERVLTKKQSDKSADSSPLVKYCRRCEFSCPVGSPGF